MGESTQYAIVTIVGIVAFVAILAMVQTSTPIVSEPTQQMTNTAGMAVTYPPYSQLDYDNDGRVSRQDSQLLADAIAFEACPDNKVCDIDKNRVLDERDLALLNELLTEPQQVQEEPKVTGNAVTTKPAPRMYRPSSSSSTVPTLLA